jgi:uncharacterized membrane protein YccC
MEYRFKLDNDERWNLFYSEELKRVVEKIITPESRFGPEVRVSNTKMVLSSTYKHLMKEATTDKQRAEINKQWLCLCDYLDRQLEAMNIPSVHKGV